jgi:hypothetical protein
VTDPVCTLGGVSLPLDMEWIDRDSWSPVAQQTEVTLGGSVIAEESAQLAGRPITLRTWQSGNTAAGTITRAQLDLLQALARAARDTPMTLVLADGGTWSVYFRHGDTAVDARPWRHVWPVEATDLYLLTLRLWATSVTPEPEE